MSERRPIYLSRWFIAVVALLVITLGGAYYLSTAVAREARDAEANAANFVEAVLKQDLDGVKRYSTAPDNAESALRSFLSAQPDWRAQNVVRGKQSGPLRIEAQSSDGEPMYVTFDRVSDMTAGGYYAVFHTTLGGRAAGDGRVMLVAPRNGGGWTVESLELSGVTMDLY